MNSVNLIGFVASDVRILYTSKNQVPMVVFFIGVPRNYQTRDGKSVYDYLQIRAFGRPARFAKNVLQKGFIVAIEGCMQCDKFTTEDGKRQISIYVFAHHIRTAGYSKIKLKEITEKQKEEIYHQFAEHANSEVEAAPKKSCIVTDDDDGSNVDLEHLGW